MKRSHSRAIYKTITFRIFATVITILIVFAFTGKLTLSLGIGLVEFLSKLILYYFHERIWAVLPVGIHIHPLEDLPVRQDLPPEHKEKVRKLLAELGDLETE